MLFFRRVRLFRFLFTARASLRRLPRLIASDRVPLRTKLLALALAALILSPLNILGDLPLLGIADDAALLALVLDWFVRTAARYDAGDRAPRSGGLLPVETL